MTGRHAISLHTIRSVPLRAFERDAHEAERDEHACMRGVGQTDEALEDLKSRLLEHAS